LAPAVTGITPANGASAIGDNTATRVRFNKLMDETSLNGSTITLQSGGNTLPFSLLFSGASGVTTVTLTPQAPLPDNAMITLSLGAGINDLVGQPIAAQSVSFTTANGPDVTAPVIVASNPTGAEVPVNVTTFTWRFSEPLDPLTVGGTLDYVQLYPSGAVLPSTVVLSPDGRTITLTLAGNLSPSTYYYACSVGAADLTGNVSGAGCTTIRTSSASSVTPPQVIGHNPVTGATNVAINSQIDVVFDVPVSTTSFDQITVTAGGSPVPFSVALHPYYAQLSGRAIQLIPLSLLNANTTYTVDISGVRDYAGNVMSGHYTFSFSTGVDLASPTSFSTLTARVSGVPTQLINNVYVNGVSTTTTLEALFSAPIDVASIMNGGVRLYVVGAGTLVPLTVTMSADGRTAIVTPQSPLAAGTAYRATVNYDVAVYDQALAGVSGSGGFFNFTTAP
jgi:hypothetical protein